MDINNINLKLFHINCDFELFQFVLKNEKLKTKVVITAMFCP